MTRQLPPIDMHAHIDTTVNPRDLEGLGAVVFAATRSSEEFEQTIGRHDLVTIWGIGCHPGLASAQAAFATEIFQHGLERTSYVSEVGLDRSSGVPMAQQEEVFRAILALVDKQPRIVSIHSRGATSRVLDIIAETSVRTPILHWWLGSKAETERAVELGCYFSVNSAMTSRKADMPGIPLDRLLTETDHPAGNRGGRGRPHQPGWTLDVEECLAGMHGISTEELRLVLWRNLSSVARKTDIEGLFPDPVRRMLRAAT